ncbi:MAG TPA: cation:proton antiporter [Burkholderiales bacterium]|nr:cation:proton antiporter [Burkholderiales bacterium]
MSFESLFFLPRWPLPFGQLLWVGVLLVAAIVAGEAARRWLRLPRILGYITVGAVLGPEASGVITGETLGDLHVLVEIAVGLLLFELGQRVDLGWLRRNPWLLATSVLEAGLAFAAVFTLLTVLGERPVAASAAAVLAMATSPAVVMTMVKDLRAQGQVTERLLLLTALNTTYAVVGLAIIVGWVHLEHQRDPLVMLAHPAYLVGGSLAAAVVVAVATLALLKLLGRRPGFQFSILVAIVLLTVAGAAALKLSMPLTLLLLGVLARALDRERHFVSLRFGETTMLFVVILFAAAGASLEFSGWGAAFATALGFIAARFVGKAVAILVLARASALSLRGAWLVNLGLAPMSGIALLLLQDLARFDPKLGGEISAAMVLAITILAFLGPLATEFAVRKAGEAGEARHP